MPTPALFAATDPETFGTTFDADRDAEVQVLYVTNRMPSGRVDARRYTGLRSDQLHLGVATLQVGERDETASTRQGSVAAAEERPVIKLLSAREIAALDEQATPHGQGMETYLGQLDVLLQRAARRELLVYVHGANTSFERAVAQAAQFQHYVGSKAVVVVFAWPSAGSLLRYLRDVASARHSEPQFARLLELLSTSTRVENVNVLAYSAGAMVASPGLARAAGRPEDHASLRVGEVYFAAPDIDFPVFLDNLPRYEHAVRRVTVAVNMGDTALSVAQWIHRISRAGRPNLADIGPEETRWLVDASRRNEFDVLSIRPEDLPGLPPSSHSFWYDHPWVSSDILLKLRFHAPPAARGLKADRTEIDLAFWRFPADYAVRLPAVVQALGGSGTP
jgi:esterase/lipase superfamily enzyme